MKQYYERKVVIGETKAVPMTRAFYFPQNILDHKPRAFGVFSSVEKLYDKDYSFNRGRGKQKFKAAGFNEKRQITPIPIYS
jgi:hypothetical protein